MQMLLENKNAVVHGAGGAIGGAVARAFAAEGARVFLAGRGRASLDRVAAEIVRAGGAAETAQVDALDERAVEEHAAGVAARAGGIDISFTAISHGDVHGTPLLALSYEEFARPVNNAIRAQFLTTRATARQMTKGGTGVIMAITATTARQVIPEVGGTGVAFDAIESLCRQWAAELGPLGIRVVWLQTTGIPEAFRDTGGSAPAYGTGRPMSGEQFVAWLRSRTMLDRLTTLADVGRAAAFLASDGAAAMTATGVNLSCGSVPTR
jgi:3-oxoacyl-[acyl-carrier protein] reductase